MKQLTFSVTLTFSGKITSDEDIKEIAKNIAESLKHTAEHGNIVPDGCDEYTKKIEVTPEFLSDETITSEII